MFKRLSATSSRPESAERRPSPARPGFGLAISASLVAGLFVSACGVSFAANPSSAPSSAGTMRAAVSITTSPTATPPSVTAAPTASPTIQVTPPADPTATAAPATPAATRREATAPRTTVTLRNRLIIPALGMNDWVSRTGCNNAIPNGVFYWPCAGRNNFYLVGHAWGVFRPVHDGYHRGTLKPGMALTYVDGNGVRHAYRLSWVEDLPLATFGKGAVWASTSGPVITLQTCDGANDAYRIIVRFVPA